jgi:hypothetical protein
MGIIHELPDILVEARACDIPDEPQMEAGQIKQWNPWIRCLLPLSKLRNTMAVIF